MQFWGCGAGAGAAFAKELPGFGADFKKAVKRRYPALVALHPYGEVLPRADNRVTVEGAPLDQYGVPIARIEYKIGDNEQRMAAEMYDTAESILRAAKAEILPFERGQLDIAGSAHSRARDLPHGRGSEALGAERILPDARRSECVRGGWLRFHDGQREESDADDSGAGLARDGLSGW